MEDLVSFRGSSGECCEVLWTPRNERAGERSEGFRPGNRSTAFGRASWWVRG